MTVANAAQITAPPRRRPRRSPGGPSRRSYFSCRISRKTSSSVAASLPSGPFLRAGGPRVKHSRYRRVITIAGMGDQDGPEYASGGDRRYPTDSGGCRAPSTGGIDRRFSTCFPFNFHPPSAPSSNSRSLRLDIASPRPYHIKIARGRVPVNSHTPPAEVRDQEETPS